MKTLREEIEKRAEELGMDLNYMPVPQIANIFECGEKKWQESMKNGIGSSGASAAIGKSPYKTIAEVALEKEYGRSKPIAMNDPDKQFMLDSGHSMEEAILKWYAAKLGYVVALKDSRNPSTSGILDVSEITMEQWNEWEGKGVVCVDHARYSHPLYPFMYTDMDGVVFTPEREMWVVECKTNSADPKEFKYYWRGGVWGEPNVTVGNIGYIDQARHHMAVSNCNRCDIVVANGFNASNICLVTVLRDLDEEKKLIESESKLWKMVEDGEVPEFTTLTDRSYENISYILNQEEEKNKEPIDLGEEYRDTIDEIMSLQEQIKAYESEIKAKEERINALNVQIINALGNNTLATMPSSTPGKSIKIEMKSTVSVRLDEDKFKMQEPVAYLEYSKYLREIKKDYEEKRDDALKPMKEKYPKICGGDAKLSIKEVKSTAQKKVRL